MDDNKFIEAIEKENPSLTENGAIGYATSGNPLVDFNFKLPSYRKQDSKHIYSDFMKAYKVYASLAMRYLYFLRDIRNGIGERYIFRAVLSELLNDLTDKEFPIDYVRQLLAIIPEFGRYDDLIYIYQNTSDSVKEIAFDVIRKTFLEDCRNLQDGKPVSLLAKWMPSVQCKDRKLALELAKKLDLSEREYRKILAKLRKHIDVVETHMSANDWDKIKYEAVPSKASLIYADAFKKHDSDRYSAYLTDVSEGKTKINASTLFPHEIVHKYYSDNGLCFLEKENATLEALWKNLKQIDIGSKSIITVCDVSGSMTDPNMIPMSMSHAIGIYFSEHLTGPYKDKLILFSDTPQYIDLVDTNTLRDKLNVLSKYDDCSNTNIEATFDLILYTALKHHLKQEEIPESVLVISDMEFDSAMCWYDVTSQCEKLFNVIRNKYESNGFKMPKLIFWNVASRTNTVPVQENENGVILLSGYATNLVKLVISNKLDPWEALKEQLMDKRYDVVDFVTKLTKQS